MRTPESIAVIENDIVQKIFLVRGVKVMLDKDLADMYAVETKRLKEAVRRNISRFPEDFMFELSDAEFFNLRTHFASSSWGGARYTPMVFTEQGVAMLSSVLRSERAIQVNIRIVRVYTKMRQLLSDNSALWAKLEKIELALTKKDEEVQTIFNVLKKLLVQEHAGRAPIGFKIPKKK